MSLKRILRRRDRGVAALEFALVAPILMFVMVAIADGGNALQQAIRLEAAARAGAQVAFTHPGDTRFVTNDPSIALVNAATLAKLPDWTQAVSCTNGIGNGVCASYTSWCQCPQSGNAANTSYAFACASATPPCEDYQQYASVTVTRNYSPLLFVPVTTLRGNVEIRVR